jgi:hypothetical protein
LSSARKLGLKTSVTAKNMQLSATKRGAGTPIPVLNVTPSAAGSWEKLLRRDA